MLLRFGFRGLGDLLLHENAASRLDGGMVVQGITVEAVAELLDFEQAGGERLVAGRLTGRGLLAQGRW